MSWILNVRCDTLESGRRGFDAARHGYLPLERADWCLLRKLLMAVLIVCDTASHGHFPLETRADQTARTKMLV